jgi:hypothetical protein
MREGRRDDVKNTYFFLKRGLGMLYPPLFKRVLKKWGYFCRFFGRDF